MNDRTVHIVTRRIPSIISIAMGVAPFVRLGHLTDAEGRALVAWRYDLARLSR